MNKQIILVLESKKANDSDFIYLGTYIKKKYIIDENTKITSIPMNGKNNYNSKSLIKKIKEAISKYKHGTSYVIYGYDTDDVFNNSNDSKYSESIKEYCNKNNYKLVFFCRDIEEVFLGKRIDDNHKRQEAINYARNIDKRNVVEEKLKAKSFKIGMSNLDIVLKEIGLNKKHITFE